MTPLIAPHGGRLVNLMARPDRARELRQLVPELPSWDLNARQQCDLELLMNGAFSPLDGFLGRLDYERVVAEGRLSNGTLWPIPIVLDVDEPVARTLSPGGMLLLRDLEGVPLAVVHVDEIWAPDFLLEADKVLGTRDPTHPSMRHLVRDPTPMYVGGRVEGLERPSHHTFKALRHTPAQTRQLFDEMGWTNVVAFQTRNPLHRSHFELTRQAMEEHRAKLLLHPVVGVTRPGDVDAYTRVRCYQALLPQYPEGSAMLSLLPLAMRMAGPREAILHAIVRKNFGCGVFIVGRDHAGPGKDSSGREFYPPFAAQEALRAHEKELGIVTAAYQEMIYAEGVGYVEAGKAPAGATLRSISGTELRQRLRTGREVPGWFSFPEVIEVLRKTYPPPAKQGFTVFFTGLSGAGKSTIASALMAKLMEDGRRPVTLLDGDVVRRHLSSELGFSREHRDINIRRIGFVASEITKNLGIAICAPIAPYDNARREVREMISEHGGFVLVHVATPLEACELRDRKGLYAKARKGLLPSFTGVSDPYEPPTDAEIVLTTVDSTPERDAERIMELLRSGGFV